MPNWWRSRSPIEAKIDQILVNQANAAKALAQLGARIMATLQDIQTAVAAEKTVEDSVVTLLQTLSADLKAAIASNDPAAMQAVVDQIDANTKALSDAVAANTPAAPAPSP